MGRRRDSPKVMPIFTEHRQPYLMQLYRQRKTLAPAFSTGAIRSLTPIFYDSAYKVSVTCGLEFLIRLA